MIFGRPVNQVIAAAGTILNLIVLAAKQIDPTGVGAFFTAEIILALNAAAAAVIGVLAGQPPTVVQGSNITVSTPQGEPNVVATVLSPTQITPAGPAA